MVTLNRIIHILVNKEFDFKVITVDINLNRSHTLKSTSIGANRNNLLEVMKNTLLAKTSNNELRSKKTLQSLKISIRSMRRVNRDILTLFTPLFIEWLIKYGISSDLMNSMISNKLSNKTMRRQS